jgi:cellulase (glycosyl hydrolase family 5)
LYREGRFAALICACALLLGLAAGEARAASNAEFSITDDQLLLGNRRVYGYLSAFKTFGVDRVIVSAYWRDHAPQPRALQRPSGFRADDPGDRRYDWRRLDPVVSAATKNGLKVTILITTPAPLWATAKPDRRNPVFRPKPHEFASFAAAVARRYRNSVDRYSLGNEPNQAAWLQPQSDRRGPVAPHLYRRLVQAAYPEVKAADPGAVVIIGELAPTGSSGRGARRSLRPLEFLRAMSCRTTRYRPIRRGLCRRFKPIRVDAIGSHAYSKGAPARRSRNRNDATLGDSSRLMAVIDGLTARRALVPSRGRRFDVYLTEFGYETDPPDPYAGVSLQLQNRYLQEAAYLVWKTPRLRSLNQFRAVDGGYDPSKGKGGFKEFQSGLLFRDFKPKPSARTFPHPFVITNQKPRAGQQVSFWGQARPGGAHTITIEYSKSSNGPFSLVTRLRSDSNGYFLTRLTPATGYYRYGYDTQQKSAFGVPLGTSEVLGVVVRP